MPMERWKSDVSIIARCKTCQKIWESGKIHAIARQHSEYEGHEVEVVEKTTYVYCGEKEGCDE